VPPIIKIFFGRRIYSSGKHGFESEKFFLQEKAAVINLKVQNAGQSEKISKTLVAQASGLWKTVFSSDVGAGFPRPANNDFQPGRGDPAPTELK
jgi:hypothetical protein